MVSEDAEGLPAGEGLEQGTNEAQLFLAPPIPGLPAAEVLMQYHDIRIVSRQVVDADGVRPKADSGQNPHIPDGVLLHFVSKHQRAFTVCCIHKQSKQPEAAPDNYEERSHRGQLSRGISGEHQALLGYQP